MATDTLSSDRLGLRVICQTSHHSRQGSPKLKAKVLPISIPLVMRYRCTASATWQWREPYQGPPGTGHWCWVHLPMSSHKFTKLQSRQSTWCLSNSTNVLHSAVHCNCRRPNCGDDTPNCASKSSEPINQLDRDLAMSSCNTQKPSSSLACLQILHLAH